MVNLPQSLPFGLRDVKVTPINVDGTYGTSVDLPAAQTFEFREAENFNELEGDDHVVASHGGGPVINWTLEAGGISLEALAVISGGTVSNTGATPNRVKSYTKLGGDARPYFKVEGQAISDSGGDVHGVVYRCKADGDIGGQFAGGEFYVTSASGKGYQDDAHGLKLYDFIQNETVTAIA